MATAKKVPVTLRALIQRINRKLSADDEALRRARGHAEAELGEYFIVNVDRNVVVTKNVDPARLAEELGVLAAWERLAEG